MSAHTPGPWRSQGWAPTWAYIPVHDARHNLVASMYPHTAHNYTREEVEANARLIAAAPELLAAAQMALSALDSLMGDSDLPEDDSPEMKACQALSAAIAKATDSSREVLSESGKEVSGPETFREQGGAA